MILAKCALCVSLTLFSAWALFFLRNKAHEIRAYKLLIAGVIVAKALAIIAIYTFYPDLNTGSDAVLYYYPQAQNVLSGHVPYRDFISHYSFLFPVLLAPALRLWQSVGAVVFTMFFLETLMILLYLSQRDQTDSLNRWRVGFLYSFSPISVYWIAIVGYNGSIIALFTMASLIFAQRKRDSLSVAFAVLGFSLSKVLMFLSYPAILFFGRRNRIRRTLLAAAAMAGYYALFAVSGVDILHPIEHEMATVSSGNIWFLLSPFMPAGFHATWFWNYGSILSFALLCVPLTILYLRATDAKRHNEFNAAIAFVAAVNLAFFILSKKSYTFYMPMAFIFILHTLIIRYEDPAALLRALVPVFFLSATTTLESNLDRMISEGHLTNGSVQMSGLWIIDFITIACYGYLMIVCFRASTQSGFES